MGGSKRHPSDSARSQAAAASWYDPFAKYARASPDCAFRFPGIDPHRRPVLADPLVEPPAAAVGGGEVPPRRGVPRFELHGQAGLRDRLLVQPLPGQEDAQVVPGGRHLRVEVQRPAILPGRLVETPHLLQGDPGVEVRVGQPRIETPRLGVQPERILLPSLPGVPGPQGLQEHAEHLRGGEGGQVRPARPDPELPPVPVVLPGGAALRELHVPAHFLPLVPDETVGGDVHPLEGEAEPIREGEPEHRQPEAVPLLSGEDGFEEIVLRVRRRLVVGEPFLDQQDAAEGVDDPIPVGDAAHLGAQPLRKPGDLPLRQRRVHRETEQVPASLRGMAKQFGKPGRRRRGDGGRNGARRPAGANAAEQQHEGRKRRGNVSALHWNHPLRAPPGTSHASMIPCFSFSPLRSLKIERRREPFGSRRRRLPHRSPVRQPVMNLRPVRGGTAGLRSRSSVPRSPRSTPRRTNRPADPAARRFPSPPEDPMRPAANRST